MTALSIQVMYRKTLVIDSNGMSDRCAFNGIKLSLSNQLMAESDGFAFAKGLLARRPISFSS